MKRILVLVGSGTPRGSTMQLTDAFIAGAEEAGHQVKKIFLGNKQIEGCRGCNFCQRSGGCVIKDDMQKLYPLFEESDVLVFASPLFFWTISARIKAFIERLYATAKEDKFPKKETMLLMTAGDEKFWTFEQSVSYYRFVTQAIEWQDLGMCLAGGTKIEDGKHIIKQNYLEEAFQLGKNTITRSKQND
ncbi:flavodoxin family protein [Enterococcus sp. AZ109]|uniref:flavodoxin family protein n=1 Tax=Enterococcus sp. AZ109 TaxID=2774634 RepID=UPI003F24A34A